VEREACAECRHARNADEQAFELQESAHLARPASIATLLAKIE
jgi:hypothetical protein